METLFRKVLVSERVPTTHNSHFTNKGELHLIGGKWKQWWQGDQFIETKDIEWWLEEIQLPSEDMLPIDVLLHNNTMYHDDALQKACNNGIKMCYNYILGFINNKK